MFIFYFLYLVSLFTAGFSEPQPTDGLSVGSSVTWDGIIAGHCQHVFITISEPDIIHTTQLDMHQPKKETRWTCLFLRALINITSAAFLHWWISTWLVVWYVPDFYIVINTLKCWLFWLLTLGVAKTFVPHNQISLGSLFDQFL